MACLLGYDYVQHALKSVSTEIDPHFIKSCSIDIVKIVQFDDRMGLVVILAVIEIFRQKRLVPECLEDLLKVKKQLSLKTS